MVADFVCGIQQVSLMSSTVLVLEPAGVVFDDADDLSGCCQNVANNRRAPPGWIYMGWIPGLQGADPWVFKKPAWYSESPPMIPSRRIS